MIAHRPILITGGAGFIGSHLVHGGLAQRKGPVINLDVLTYAGSLMRLADVADDPEYTWIHGDINNRSLVSSLLAEYRPWAIIHAAAESHVDRSIDAPAPFVQTNIVGTQVLLDASREYWHSLPAADRTAFRFLYVSTDEVFGPAQPPERHDETSPFRPSSPYAASKAAADLLVQAYHRTYGLPVVTVNLSNTYGPWQLPEKLIPRLISLAMAGDWLPIYGDGLQVRDWLHVDDCCRAIWTTLENGPPGERYVAGGCGIEQTNLEIAESICDLIDPWEPQLAGRPRRALIRHIADRPGHDRRYALDCTKIQNELAWKPRTILQDGLRATVQWYLDNRSWVDSICRRIAHAPRHGVLNGEQQ
ncbi:MAG: dTDP-glucose 4,6-dehydratase [Pirellulales bacterium]|nr:dTDP-glucose 4,6-dehydratase [Pirellulales bacterium]